MATRISRDRIFYAFEANLAPAVRVKPGEEVIFETYDCFQGQIRTDRDLVASLDWNRTNPATGPIYIEGARPGTILRIDILDIEVEDNSVMVAIPGEGALGDRITDMETTILRRDGDELVSKDLVRIPQGTHDRGHRHRTGRRIGRQRYSRISRRQHGLHAGRQRQPDLPDGAGRRRLIGRG